MVKRLIGAVLLAACLGLVACSLLPVSISEIQAHPERYENHVVTVRGTVTSATKFPFMDKGFYTLKDGTGEITVVTTGELPPQGEKRTVRGTVSAAFKVMDRSFGLTIKEKQ